jgi:hypothetical protein
MGILDKMKEKQAQLQDKVHGHRREELEQYLLQDETVQHLFNTDTGAGQDFAAITDRRVLAVDKTMITAKSAVYSFPISRILFVSLERGGLAAISKTVEFGISGKSISLKFLDESTALTFHKALSEAIS